jgi:hypothetical protein
LTICQPVGKVRFSALHNSPSDPWFASQNGWNLLQEEGLDSISPHNGVSSRQNLKERACWLMRHKKRKSTRLAPRTPIFERLEILND